MKIVGISTPSYYLWSCAVLWLSRGTWQTALEFGGQVSKKHASSTSRT